MRRIVATLTVLGMAVAMPAFAQQPAAPGTPAQPAPQMSAPRGPHAGPPAGGMMPMMDMCQQMMAGGMMSGPHAMAGGMMGGGGMMAGGMMGGPQSTDPKMMAHMMEMRGEMMKAMGEIMMKHAQKMQPARP
jgi:hypothetical protein